MQTSVDEYAALVRKCTKSRDLVQGQRLHSCILKSLHGESAYLNNLLIEMYGKSGSIAHARLVFDRMQQHQQRNIFSWNIMLVTYAQNGQLQLAEQFFDEMPQRNVVSWNTMVAAYAQQGHLRTALETFERMPVRSVVTWACMVTAYAQNGQNEEALRLFLRMELDGFLPNEAAFIAAICACASLCFLKLGQLLHAEVAWNKLSSNSRVLTCLINMYGKCGCVELARSAFPETNNVICSTAMISAYALNGHLREAREMFDKLPNPDIVAWTTMITAHARHDELQQARLLFDSMRNRNVICWNAMLSAYAQKGHLDDAAGLFSTMPERDASTCSIMVTAFAESGKLAEARALFEEMPHRNTHVYNVLLAAYAREGQSHESIHLFKLMDLEGLEANETSFVTILQVCAGISASAFGKAIHEVLPEAGISLLIGTGLINMYSKCGCLADALLVFKRMKQQDVVSWTAIVVGCAHNGYATESLDLFRLMCHEGFEPNQVTLLGVLHACSHGGKLDESHHFFTSAVEEYSVEFDFKHYQCMVDILNRAGWLEDALDLLRSIPELSVYQATLDEMLSLKAALCT